MNPKRLTIVLFSLLLLTLVTQVAYSDQFTVNLSSGSVIVVEADEQTLDWKTIARNGEMEEVALTLSQIQRLDLTDRPASVQVLRVRKLLQQLDSDDFQSRVDAQNELSQPAFGRRFKDLIESELTNDSLEVRVRVRQILAAFRSTNQLEKPEYDRVFLKNKDESLVGDVGDFVFQCNYRGQKVALKREYLRRLTRLPKQSDAPQNGLLETRLLHEHKPEYLEDPSRFIDFEVDGNEEELVTNSDISRAFESQGLIFEAEEKNFVGVSSFTLQYQNAPTGGNSVCPFEQGRGYTRKFRGVVRISFCEPGLPDSPAGVYQFGLFAARIDNPRDIILEAYNQNSQMIGCVESSDGLAFMGVETNEPIAFVRVLSNPYLFELPRHVDETYVIDHVWFGERVALKDAKLARVGDQLSTVVLDSGDILSVEDVRFTENGGLQVYEPQLKRRMTFPREQVHSVRLSGRSIGQRVANTTSQLRVPEPTSDQWRVMLNDRSVLTVKPGATFQSKLLGDVQLNREEVVGLWAVRDQIRLPVAKDFEKGKQVLVFPTCRVIADVELSEQGVSWNINSEKIEQPIFTGTPSEDATPKFNEFEFDKRTESQMPSIWFRQPSLEEPIAGAIELVDGQRIVLGGASGFAIKSVNDQIVSVVGQDDLSVNIPMTQVSAIKFPK